MTYSAHLFFGHQVVSTFGVARLVEINVPKPMLYLTQMTDGQLRLEMSTGMGRVDAFTRFELRRDDERPPLVACCQACGAVRSPR